MAIKSIDTQHLTNIANAIRNKTDKTDVILLNDMAEQILSISTGSGGIELPELTNEGSASDLLSGKELIDDEGNIITGTFTIDNELTAQDDLIAQIQSALEGKAAGKEPVLQSKTVNPSTSSQTIKPDSNYDGLSQVTVNPIPSSYVIPSGTKTITTNGTHDVKAYASATVNVACEDVTSETNIYTTKLVALETAITALETELQGKASGGSGGGNETVTCTINALSPMGVESIIKYVDGDGNYQEAATDGTFTVMKNSIVCVEWSGGTSGTISGGITQIGLPSIECKGVFVTGDFTVIG